MQDISDLVQEFVREHRFGKLLCKGKLYDEGERLVIRGDSEFFIPSQYRNQFQKNKVVVFLTRGKTRNYLSFYPCGNNEYEIRRKPYV